MATPRTTLWSHRHKQWLRQLERTAAPTFRFEHSHGPRLRKLPDWSRELPVAASASEWKPSAAR
jgi:hypothetical protein